MSDDGETGGSSRALLGPRLVAVVLLALGLLVLYQTFQIGQGGGYSAIGPRFFPLLVSIGLLLLAVLFLLRTTQYPDETFAAEVAAEEAATDWPTVALVALALVLYAFALGTLGYIVATALFYPVVARVLGSRHSLRDAFIGIALGVVIYIGFTRFLGVRLPAGLLDFLA